MDDELKEALEIAKTINFPKPSGSFSDNGNYTEYPMKKGKCRCWPYFDGDSFRIDKWWNSKGCEFPSHSHSEKEYVFIERGSLILHKNGESKTYGAGDMFYNEPTVVHSATFPDNCVYFTITIPPSKDYP
ncbi:MAG: cupin domain-containing protein [bacterium]|nr:cupin domain-containing protein [bacterium]